MFYPFNVMRFSGVLLLAMLVAASSQAMASTPNFSFATPFDGVDVGQKSAPAFADLDKDGDLDAFFGNLTGTITYYENTGSNTAPVFTLGGTGTAAANPFAGISVGVSSKLSFADLDNDNDLDAFIGDETGTIIYYENTGGFALPVFTLGGTGGTAANPFSGINVGGLGYSAPSFADLDNDGDLDAFLGAFYSLSGTIIYYENTGTNTVPIFTLGGTGSAAANPFSGTIVVTYSKPDFADLDSDGDLDAFIGNQSGSIVYYENTGTVAAPVFTLGGTGLAAANPFNGMNVGGLGFSSPSFADLDNDGDLDAFIGNQSGTIVHYINAGTQAAPNFIEPPLKNINVGTLNNPSLVDIDNDGDMDLFIGEALGTIIYYENTGTSSVPVYTLGGTGTAAANPLAGIDVGNESAPSFGDLDNDGDLDAFIGDSFGKIAYVENIGTNSVPNFVAVGGLDEFGVAVSNPLAGKDVGFNSKVIFTDIDNDGDLDALVGESNRGILLCVNAGSVNTPSFLGGCSSFQSFSPPNLYSLPAFADLDSDGDLDVFFGNNAGPIIYYENTARVLAYYSLTVTLPVFTLGGTGSAAANPFAGFVLGPRSAPAFADIDGDGDMDALVGVQDGSMKLFINKDPSPVATTDNLTTVFGNANSIDVTANDRFKTEAPAANFNITSFTQAANGTVTRVAGTNTFTYTPNAYFNGLDFFTYSLDDGAGHTIIGRVNVTAHDNFFPTASSVAIADSSGGRMIVGDQLTGSYIYADADGDPEGVSTFRWLRDGVAIPGATTTNYSVLFSDIGSIINFEVTPVATIGAMIGSAVVAAAPLPVMHVESPLLGIYSRNISFVDIDGDGDLDLYVASTAVSPLRGTAGSLDYYENTGTKRAPIFTPGTATHAFDSILGLVTLAAVRVTYDWVPTFADMDNDGDFDAYIGRGTQQLFYFKNTGTKLVPNFIRDAYYTVGHVIHPVPKPILADLNNDGYLDLFYGNSTGDIRFLANPGTFINEINTYKVATDMVPAFYRPRTLSGVDPQFGGQLFHDSAPAFADLDKDGDMDIVVGNSFGTIRYFENIGSTGAPLFTLGGTGAAAANPFAGVLNAGPDSAPVFADIDGDGDKDLFIATRNGTITFIENMDTRPQANTDNISTRAGIAINTGDVLANDVFKANAPAANFSIIAFTQGANGTVLDNGNNTFTYSPNAGFVGRDTFTYSIDDGSAQAVVGIVNISVTPANVAPVVHVSGIGNLLKFNGSNQIVALGVFDDITQFSVGAWINVSGNTGTRETVFSFQDGCGFNLVLNNDNVSQRPRIEVYVNSVLQYAESSIAIPLNTDTHVAASYDGATIKLYVNGQLAASTAAAGAMERRGIGAGSCIVHYSAIGAVSPEFSLAKAFFRGTIESVTLWNSARTQAELQSDVNKTVLGNEAGLMAYWKMNQGKGDIAIDSSIYEKDGKLGRYSFRNSAALLQPLWISLQANNTSIGSAFIGSGSFTDLNTADPWSATVDYGDGTGFQTLALNPDKSFNLSHVYIAQGYYTLTVTISDGMLSDSASALVQVLNINTAPVANSDIYSTDEDTNLQIAAAGVLANDTDIDGDPLTANLVTGPIHGSLTLNADGSFSYTPNANYNGSDSFTYDVSDGQGGMATGTVNITINPINDAPLFSNPASNPYAISMNEDTMLNFTAMASDIDGDTPVFSMLAAATHGISTIDSITGVVSYMPVANYNGLDAFTLQTTDGNSGSDTVVVNVIVNPTNDQPVISMIGATPVTLEAGGVYTDAGASAADIEDGDISASIVVNNAVNTSVVGSYSVSFDVADSGGLAAMQVTRTVNVVDTTPANIVILGNNPETVEAGSIYADAGATAMDIVDGDITASISVSNTVNMAVPGAYTVTYSVTDAAGNAALAVRHVNVTDATAPVISTPADVNVEANAISSTVAIGTATASDLVDGIVSVSNNAPATFPLGTTTVTYTASDAAGNTATATQSVTVVDSTAPVLSVPANISTEATGSLTTFAAGTATATDIFGFTITDNAPVSFVLGTTVVTYTATDVNGNVSTAIQNVTMVDTTAPVIIPALPVVLTATGIQTTVTLVPPLVTDLSTPVSLTNNAPLSFPLGLTTVIWTATDAQGNIATLTQSVTLNAPNVTLLIPAQIALLTPPQLALLTPAQITGLTALQLVAMTPAQLAVVGVNLVPGQVAVLTPVQFSVVIATPVPYTHLTLPTSHRV